MIIDNQFVNDAINIAKLFHNRIVPLITAVENNIWHENDNDYAHTITVYTNLLKLLDFSFVEDSKQREKLIGYYAGRFWPTKYSRGYVLLVATYLHDIAKRATMITNEVTQETSCPDHPEKGAKIVTELLENYQYAPSFRNKVYDIILWHHVPHEVFSTEKTTITVSDFPPECQKIALDLATIGCPDTQGSQLKILNREEYDKRIALYENFFNNFEIR